MKTCPACHRRMEDSLQICPECGADYVSTVVNEMTSGVHADSELLLDNLEEGLAPIEEAPLPTPGETARRSTFELSAIALIFCLLAGFVTRANIFYLAGIIPLLVLVPSLAAVIRHHRPMGKGEVIVEASARIFAEDAGKARRQIAGDKALTSRLDNMQRRLDEALARQRVAHARNAKKIVVIVCAALLVAGSGVGMLAVRTHAVRQAREAYEQQPEWVKLRDSYLSATATDESGDASARTEVVRAMTEAGATGEAEAFFFAHCQGNTGDTESAWLLVDYYRSHGEKEALETFLSKVSLRYDSDTRKIRSLKR